MPNLRTSGTIAAQLLMTAVVSLVISLHATMGGNVHRSSFTQALSQYRQSPTAENERVFREEQRQLYRDQNRFGAGVAVISFVVLSAGVFLCRLATKTEAASLALMLGSGLTGSAFTATTVDAWVNGVHVYGETTNMLPGMLVGMPVGLAVAVVVFRKRRHGDAR